MSGNALGDMGGKEKEARERKKERALIFFFFWSHVRWGSEGRESPKFIPQLLLPQEREKEGGKALGQTLNLHSFPSSYLPFLPLFTRPSLHGLKGFPGVKSGVR
jgi:hypothetical protein